MEIWGRKAVDMLKKRRQEEVEERKKNRKDYEKLLNDKVNKVRKEGENMDNYVPYLMEFEEQNLLKENLIKQFSDRLWIAILRSPNVYSSERYKNEGRFSTLNNSDNCYEDNRVTQMTKLIEEHLTPALLGNKILEFYVEKVLAQFLTVKEISDKK